MNKSITFTQKIYDKYINLILIIIVSFYSIFFTKDIFFVYGFKTTLFYILVLIGLIYFIKLDIKDRKKHVNKLKKIKIFNIGFIIIITMSILSTIGNDYLIESIIGSYPNLISVLLYMFSFVFINLVSPVLDNINYKKLFNIGIIVFVFLSIIISYQFFYNDFLTHKEDVKVFVSLGNRNYAVIPYTLLLIISIVNFILNKKNSMLIPISFFYSMLLVSLTRGAWISFFISIIFIIPLIIKYDKRFFSKNKKNIIILITIFIVIFIIVNLLCNWLVLDRIFNSINDDINYASSDRINTWNIGIKLLNTPSRLLIGISPSVSNYYGIKYTNFHNQYLESLVSMGIFGFLGFVIVILSINYYGYKIASKDISNIGLYWGSLFVSFKYFFNSINSVNFVYVLILFSMIISKYIKKIK